MFSRRSSAAVALALLTFAAPAHAALEAEAEPERPAPGEAILEGRLLAPCCWTQTLDVHESELATSLRGEIRRRLAAGEASTVIEDDLAGRYGERIRAVPKGGDVRVAVPIVSGIFAVAAGVGLGFLLLRWTRRGSRNAERPPAGRARDSYDERIDDALRDLDA